MAIEVPEPIKNKEDLPTAGTEDADIVWEFYSWISDKLPMAIYDSYVLSFVPEKLEPIMRTAVGQPVGHPDAIHNFLLLIESEVYNISPSYDIWYSQDNNDFLMTYKGSMSEFSYPYVSSVIKSSFNPDYYIEEQYSEINDEFRYIPKPSKQKMVEEKVEEREEHKELPEGFDDMSDFAKGLVSQYSWDAVRKALIDLGDMSLAYKPSKERTDLLEKAISNKVKQYSKKDVGEFIEI